MLMELGMGDVDIGTYYVTICSTHKSVQDEVTEKVVVHGMLAS